LKKWGISSSTSVLKKRGFVHLSSSWLPLRHFGMMKAESRAAQWWIAAKGMLK
jgi:hypothetical protein